MTNYTAYPPFIHKSVPPAVMLMMTKDHRLFFKGYNDIVDLDNGKTGGDAAIEEVIAAYEAANAEKPIAGKRWALEHGFITQPDQVARLKKLDLVISAQDPLYLAGPRLANSWGPDRAAPGRPAVAVGPAPR